MAERDPPVNPELVKSAWNNCVILGRLAIRQRSSEPTTFVLPNDAGHAVLLHPAFLNEPHHKRDRIKYLWLPPPLLAVMPSRLLTHKVIIVPQTSDEPPRRVVLEVNSSIAPFAGGMYINQPVGEVRLPAEQIEADLGTISRIQTGDHVGAAPTVNPEHFKWE